jgi:hypothetical protein
MPAAAAKTAESVPAALSTRWSGLPTSAAAMDRAPVSMSNSYAEEQSTADLQEEMPLIWPILTPAELAAVERVPAFTISFAQLAAAFAAVLGLAALILRIILRYGAARPRPSKAEDHWRPDARAPRRGKRVFAAFTDTAARAGQSARSTVNATTPSRHDQAADVEASVRGLLHELQRRQRHGEERRDFKPASRHVTA